MFTTNPFFSLPACRNSFYEQNVRMVGAVFLMRQGNNGRIRSLPTWRLIYPGALTVTPWWRPPAWQLSAAHGGGCGTTSPAWTDVGTNQASAHIKMPRASLDKRRSIHPSIRSTRSTEVPVVVVGLITVTSVSVPVVEIVTERISSEVLSLMWNKQLNTDSVELCISIGWDYWPFDPKI